MTDNVLTLQRDGVPLTGYRAFQSPDELARRRRALELGEGADVVVPFVGSQKLQTNAPNK